MKYVDVWITKTVCNKKYSSSLQVCTNSHSMLWWVSPNLSLSLKHWQQHKRQCTKPSRLESTYPALIIRLRPEEYISSCVSAQRKAVLSLNTVTLSSEFDVVIVLRLYHHLHFEDLRPFYCRLSGCLTTCFILGLL